MTQCDLTEVSQYLQQHLVHVHVFSSRQGNSFWDRIWRSRNLRLQSQCYWYQRGNALPHLFLLFIYLQKHLVLTKINTASLPHLTLRQLSWRQRCYKQHTSKRSCIASDTPYTPVSSLQISIKWEN